MGIPTGSTATPATSRLVKKARSTALAGLDLLSGVLLSTPPWQPKPSALRSNLFDQPLHFGTHQIFGERNAFF